MPGSEGPARLRVRAEGACSLPTAAIALAAIMVAPASGARRQRHLPALPACRSPVTGCCFRCISAVLPQAAISSLSAHGLVPFPGACSYLRDVGADGGPGIWTHDCKWDPKTFYFYSSEVTRDCQGALDAVVFQQSLPSLVKKKKKRNEKEKKFDRK